MRKRTQKWLILVLITLFMATVVACKKDSTTKNDHSTTIVSTTEKVDSTTVSYDSSKRGDTTIYLHYLRYKADYDGWDLWAWESAPSNLEGQAFEFVKDSGDYSFGGVVATISITKEVTAYGFLIRKGGDSWTSKDIGSDRFITVPENANEDTPVHVYVSEATNEFTIATAAPKVQERLLASHFIDEDTLVASATSAIDLDSVSVSESGSELTIIKKTLSDEGMTLTVDLSSKVDYSKNYEVSAKFDDISTTSVTFQGLYDYSGFKDAFNYDGVLGVAVSSNKTTFRLWAPVSTEVKLNLYDTGTTLGDSSPSHYGTDTPIKTVNMTKSVKGTWFYQEMQDLHGYYYTYSVNTGGMVNEVVDPYAFGCGVNGKRGLIVDFNKINPLGWDYGLRAKLDTISSSSIYEMHVRDMTVSETWTGKEKKGTFAALAESGTLYKTYKTGFDHIKELGVTTVQILPFFDFSDGIDETKMNDENSKKYSWGYMPLNYNCLEGSYSDDPYDGMERIIEFKKMVMAYTEANIRINMDVVYNHVASAESSSFNLIVPSYYFRSDASGNFTDGSGCGNETASERYMMRKFMVDSTYFWAKEYNISGFRFDLMGLHDITTMNQIASNLKSLDNSIMIYGEPWTGGSTPLASNEQAKTANILSMPNIGTFNDSFRDAVKGNTSDVADWGYVQGKSDTDLVNKIKSGLSGTFSYDFGEPYQVIDYVACHDNNTLHDKLAQTKKADGSFWSDDELVQMAKQAEALTILGESVAFIYSGDEILRAKVKEDGSYDHNSFNSGDLVNGIDWSNKEKYFSLFAFVRDLISIRKEHPSFHLNQKTSVASSIYFYDYGNNVIAYSLGNSISNDECSSILIITSNASANIALPSGTWKLMANNLGYSNSNEAYSGSLSLNKNDVYIFYK